MATIAIYVEGGNVTAVTSDDPTIQVIMVDYDNIDEGDEEPEIPETLIHTVY